MTASDEPTAELDALRAANLAFAARYPGDRGQRQPVHTVYGGAHLFRADTTRRLGAIALGSMDEYASDPIEFARGVGFVADETLAGADASALAAEFERDPRALRDRAPWAWLAFSVHARVRAKLSREPVEDFRIDFEDGFGARSDAEEDAVADGAARALASSIAQGNAPPFVGIRVKSMGEEWRSRSARTLDRFVSALLGATGGVLPDGFVVTLPKVTVAEQPRLLARLLDGLEKRHGLKRGAVAVEVMIEATQALLGADGRSPLLGYLDACEGRCRGVHFGTYDFTASCNVTAAEQRMDHPMCDLAKGLMLLAYAGTGVFLSDGATNVLPIAPHTGGSISATQRAANRSAVHRAWRISHAHIRHSLRGGFYQGWDLHPAQLPVRFATSFACFIEDLAPTAARLRHFVDTAARATTVGDVFDDAATGQGLLNFFQRAYNSGAIEEADLDITGLTRDEIALRSFTRILAARRARLG